jgi:hypothetical protein
MRHSAVSEHLKFLVSSPAVNAEIGIKRKDSRLLKDFGAPDKTSVRK